MNKTRTMTALCAGAVGYVIGTRAGRARYEAMRGSLRKVAADPRVQEVAHRAQDKVAEKAPAVTERVTAVSDKVRHSSGAHAGGTTTERPEPTRPAPSELDPYPHS